MNIKLVGAALIILGCGGAGFSFSMAYRREEQLLQQLIRALDYMGCELQYRMTPLPELCRQTASGRKGVIGKLFQNLASELDSQISPDVCCCLAAAAATAGDMPAKIQQAICLLGDSLGRFDLEGQLHGIDAVRSFCQAELENMAAGREVRLRSYQTLGLCAGAALAILLV